MTEAEDHSREDPMATLSRTKTVRFDRRDFLVLAAGASLGASGIFVGATIIQALMPPARSIDGLTDVGPFVVARLSDLQIGVPVLTDYGDDRVFVVKTSPATAIVFDAACPHARCTLRFSEDSNRFECPCHASSFSIEGKKLGGPSPRDMVLAATEVMNGEVIVSGFLT